METKEPGKAMNGNYREWNWGAEEQEIWGELEDIFVHLYH